MTDRMSFSLHLGNRTFNSAIGRTPTQYEDLAFLRTAVEFLFRNMIRNTVYFFLPDLYHELVVLGFIIYITRYILLFQSPDAMLQSCSTRNCPGSYEFFITQVR